MKIRKRFFPILCCALAAGASAFAAAAPAAENEATNKTSAAAASVPVKVRVTGDRVSLRARPDLNAELLDRAMRGEEYIYLSLTNDWVAIQAPDSLDMWVSAKYVKDGVVQPDRLNVRSGPSLNYSVMNVVKKGDRLVLRGEFNGWLKIAPPPGTRVWINDKYVQLIEPPKPKPKPEKKPKPKSAPKPAPVPSGTAASSSRPARRPVAAAVVKSPAKRPKIRTIPPPPPLSEEERKPLLLVLDKTKPQGRFVEVPGILRRANPGLYKLVYIEDGIEEPVCLVRGQRAQMERLLNRSMLIKGKQYWAKGVELPIIQPVKIHLDPILSE